MNLNEQKEFMKEKINKEFKGKSVGQNGRACLYRGLEGKKCVVGLLIPDDQYNPNMEGVGVDNPKIRDISALKGFSIDFLFNLQVAHDELCETSSLQEQKDDLINSINDYN